jgi:hypothetical protein
MGGVVNLPCPCEGVIPDEPMRGVFRSLGEIGSLPHNWGARVGCTKLVPIAVDDEVLRRAEVVAIRAQAFEEGADQPYWDTCYDPQGGANWLEIEVPKTASGGDHRFAVVVALRDAQGTAFFGEQAGFKVQSDDDGLWNCFEEIQSE